MRLRTPLLILIIVGVLSALLCVGAMAAPAGYLYEVDHAITASVNGATSSSVMVLQVYNTSGTNGNNIMYVGTSCRTDFNDLLINDSTDTITFPHWINWTASDANHVQVEYNITTGVPLGGTTIKIYYGYSAASNHENLWGVYQVYDHFDGASLNATAWTEAGTVTVTGSAVSIANAGDESIASKVQFGVNNKVTFVAKYYAASWVYSGFSTHHTINYQSTAPVGMFAAAAYDGSSWTRQALTDYTGAYHTYQICRQDGTIKYYVDNLLVWTYTNTTVNSDDLIYFWNAGAGPGTPEIDVDFVKVEPYNGAAPTDGSWGIPNSDILQTIPYTLYKIDVFGLSIGPCMGATVTVSDVNGNAVKSGTTGTDGSVSFQLYRNTYYNIRFVEASQSIDKTWSGYPSDINGYIVYVYPWEFVWTNQSHGQSDVNKAIVTFITVEANGTSGDITAYYNDTSLTTSTATVSVYKRNNSTNETLIDTYTAAGNSNFNVLFTVADVSGQDYKVVITSTSAKYGSITRSYPWRFPGPKYPVAGLPAMAYTWLGFIIPTFVALTASYRNVKFAPIIFCAMSWIFVMIGWMDQMGPLYEIGLAVVTVFAVIFIFKMKQSEGY